METDGGAKSTGTATQDARAAWFIKWRVAFLSALKWTPTALQVLRERWALSKKVGDVGAEVASSQGMTDVFVAKEEYTAALEKEKEVLSLLREQGKRNEEAMSLLRIADVHRLQDGANVAVPVLREAQACVVSLLLLFTLQCTLQ